MKASFQWLRALVPQIPDDPSAVAARLTAAGLEVEGQSVFGAGTEACEIVAVVSSRPHPNKSGLKLVTVQRESGTLEVVCGAPNVPEPSGLVVLAPLGARLPAKGMTIERRAIGGVTSEGMLCSEAELGLTEEGDGILVLPPGTGKPGARFSRAIPEANDTIFEIGLTPNRPDALGHLGLARELAALYDVPFSPPSADVPPRLSKKKVDEFIHVSIEDGERCPHYAGAVVVDAKVGPSPLWLRYRLAALGVRSISNLVDITNLVMLESGHPMHAFDLDKVRGGKIIVRRARVHEVLKTLDGAERRLDPDDLVIADAEGPVALAGVMGGEGTEISASTTRLLLECAYFEARGVRRTARRHGLHTDASHRFERGVDHGDTEATLAHAVNHCVALANATATTGTSFVVARQLPAASVRLRTARMDRLLGLSIPKSDAHAILTRLGFEVREASDGELECLVPSHRPDVTRECDVIDEVARVYGFDRIPEELPSIRASDESFGQEKMARRAREAAVSVGLSEAMLFGFTSKELLARVGAPEPVVQLRNPLAEQNDVMRTSLLPGLLDSVARARRHGERDVALFAVGRVFLPGRGDWPFHEPLSFAAVVAGERHAWLEKPRAVDAWDAKGWALGMIERLGQKADARPFESDGRPVHLHPRGAGELVVGKAVVGTFGLLHPAVVEAFELSRETIVVELDLQALLELGPRVPVYVPIPRFPASSRDIALVVSEDVAAGAVEDAIRNVAGSLAERVEIFDRFTGKGVPEQHVSLAFRVVYRAVDRTLTDVEVDAQHARVIAEVGKRFGATLRA